MQSPCKEMRLSIDPPFQRAPPEIWELVAAYTPRHHLRTWLFVSKLYRDIASRHIFHAISILFDEDQDNVHRGLDIFDRATNDPVFASRVKSLRLHWAFEEAWHRVGDMVNLIIRTIKTSLPAFKALRYFEWIGYPEIGYPNFRVEMVQALLDTHKDLHGLRLVFYASGLSAFENLRNFTLRMNHGVADIGKVRTVLDRNESTLKRLTLGGFYKGDCSWDLTFESGTINKLTHLKLVNMDISHFVLTRVVHAHNLQSLTLHGSFVDSNSVSVVFGSDHITDGSHSILPLLEEFRFTLVDRAVEPAFYHPVVHFLRKREKIRRLDVGCALNIIQDILPDLRNLRVLAVRITHLSQAVIDSLVDSIPTQMVAIRLSVDVSDKPLSEYARYFTRFSGLSFLHLGSCNDPPTPKNMSEEVSQMLGSVVATIPSLDFLAWNSQLYVVVRSHGDVELRELPTTCVDVGSEDAAWLEDAMEFEE